MSLLEPELNLHEITGQVSAALSDLLQAAGLKPGQVLVAGGSTSEVMGKRIGSCTNLELADAILDGILPQIRDQKLYLAIHNAVNI